MTKKGYGKIRLQHSFYQRITEILGKAKRNVALVVNTQMAQAYWLIGHEIVDEEQRGNKKAEYGSMLIEELSCYLTKEYGAGWSPSHLWHIRQFYLTYKDRTVGILHAVRAESKKDDFLHILHPELSWTHYRLLMQIESTQARSFYEIECIKNHWSTRELERQKNSLLYERLALSKDKKGLMRLAAKGQEMQSYKDAIKDPYVLEFLGLPESSKLYENKLEQALIDNLSKFLLELGRGFTFVARQKRITLDGDHFFIDLVFYNIILKCYVLIDLKIGKFTHQDFGQMLMYVNYYNAEIKRNDDNPTVGLILCENKKEAVVRYMLAEESKKIFVSRYKLHLPSEKELKEELIREKAVIEQRMRLKP